MIYPVSGLFATYTRDGTNDASQVAMAAQAMIRAVFICVRPFWLALNHDCHVNFTQEVKRLLYGNALTAALKAAMEE